jgi:hypothetical protein
VVLLIPPAVHLFLVLLLLLAAAAAVLPEILRLALALRADQGREATPVLVLLPAVLAALAQAIKVLVAAQGNLIPLQILAAAVVVEVDKLAPLARLQPEEKVEMELHHQLRGLL